MASFNRVILVGNLTRDPQLKYLPSNTAVCEFGLAVNHKWRDKEGNQKEDVCFVDVAAFGKQGEIINQYMAKGRSILVEGRLKLDQWTGQDGSKRSKHSVVVENFTFLGSGPGGAPGGPGREGGEGAPRSAPRGGGSASGYGGRPAPDRAAARDSYNQAVPEPAGGDAPDASYDERPARGDDIPF